MYIEVQKSFKRQLKKKETEIQILPNMYAEQDQHIISMFNVTQL